MYWRLDPRYYPHPRFLMRFLWDELILAHPPCPLSFSSFSEKDPFWKAEMEWTGDVSISQAMTGRLASGSACNVQVLVRKAWEGSQGFRVPGSPIAHLCEGQVAEQCRISRRALSCP